MNFAASRNERPGVIVSTCALIASRTLMCRTLQTQSAQGASVRPPHGARRAPPGSCTSRSGRSTRQHRVGAGLQRRRPGGSGSPAPPEAITGTSTASGDGAHQREVVAVLRAVAVHRREQDLPAPRSTPSRAQLDRVAARSASGRRRRRPPSRRCRAWRRSPAPRTGRRTRRPSRRSAPAAPPRPSSPTTLSAPASSTACASATSRTPPPIVNGTKTSSAARRARSTTVPACPRSP